MMIEDIRLVYEKTGEHRCPRAGEWFLSQSGFPEQARFDFAATQFDIVTEKTIREQRGGKE